MRRWANAPLEAGIVVNGLIATPLALGDRLRDLMNLSGIQARRVVTSLSGAHVLTRTLTFPVVEGENVDQRVLQEAQRVLPVPPETMYLSWHSMLTSPEERQILLIAVPRRLVDEQVASLRAAGVQPFVLNLKALALAAVANATESIILNVDPSSVDVSLVVNGSPRLLHTVAQRQDSLTPDQEARQVAALLGRAVKFYNRKHLLEPLPDTAPVFVAGRSAPNPDFLEALEESSGHPIGVFQPPLECPSHLPVTEYAVNIGLALRPGMALSREASRTQVVAANLAPNAQLGRWRGAGRPLLGLLGVLLGIMIFVLLLAQVLSPAQRETETLQNQLTILEARRILIEQQARRSAELLGKIGEFNQISRDRGIVSEFLYLVEELRLPGLKFGSLTYSSEGINLRIHAPDLETAETYVQILRETGRFAAVELPQESGGGPGSGGVSLEVDTKFKDK